MYVALTDRVGFVPGGTNVGIIRNDERHVTLVDTGLNDTIARKALRCVRDELGSEVVAILNTHGHADHFGANAFVVKRTGCEVWAPAIEATTIIHPVMQPALLYGGADPLDALRNRFLLAEPSPLDGELQAGPQEFMGTSLDLIALPGHSPNQMGVLVDGIFFSADVVFPEAAIGKYRIPYLFGLTDHLASLTLARSIAAQSVVPGHGPHFASLDDLVSRNVEAIDRTIACMLDVLREPRTSDDVCAHVFERLDVPVSDAQSYFLLKPTINAYLAHLDRVGQVAWVLIDSRLLWHRR